MLRPYVVAVVLGISTLVAHAQTNDLSGIESEPLKKGLAAFDELDYPRALEQFRAAQKESLTKRERTVLFRAQALIHSATDDTAAAIADFERVLRINPLFELDRNQSPKVRSAFYEAKANIAKQALAPPLNATRAPDPLRAGQSLTLSVTAPSGTERLELFHRVKGNRDYVVVIAQPNRDGATELVIPGAAVDGPAMEYHLRAVNSLDQTIAADGTVAEPVFYPVRGGKVATVGLVGTTPATPAPSSKRNAIITGVVVGGIVVIGLAIGLGIGLSQPRGPADITIKGF